MNAMVSSVRWLGQAGPAQDLAAWEAYLKALRANIIDSWSRAVSAYTGLKNARADLDLPFMIAQGAPEAGAPGMSSAASWAPDLEQNAMDLMAMVQLIVNAIDDVLSNKRKLVWDQTIGALTIEALPGDIRLVIQNGVPVLVNQSGAQVHPVSDKGIGAVGIPPLVWLATATTSVLALPAYFIVQKAVNNMTDVAEQKTIQTISEKSYDCVKSGKCTPEQAANLNKSLYDGASGLRESKAKEAAAKAKPTTDITKAITTVALVGLGLAVIYAVVRLVPAPSARAAPRTPRSRRLGPAYALN